MRDNGKMRAWLMDSSNGVENLRLAEVDTPSPGRGEVLLRIRFAALNPADAFLAKAMYPAKPSLPHILGRDGAGDVVAVGDGVDNVSLGHTAVILRCDAGVEKWGTLAEYTVVPAESVVPVPAGWSLEQAAAAPLVFLTAWQALTQWSAAPPQEGSVVLVTGASGGVGVATVLLAKSMKLTVVALSRSAQKCEELKSLGADFAFDPNDPNLRKSITAAIAPRKVDLAVDAVAGPLFNQVVALLGYGGCISVLGRSGGTVPDFNTAMLFFKRNKIGGVAVGDFTPSTAKLAWDEIVRRLAEVGHQPVVDSVHMFEDVKTAFHKLDQGPMGKVLVRVTG
jgi:NADPH2:quinone reductase